MAAGKIASLPESGTVISVCQKGSGGRSGVPGWRRLRRSQWSWTIFGKEMARKWVGTISLLTGLRRCRFERVGGEVKAQAVLILHELFYSVRGHYISNWL